MIEGFVDGDFAGCLNTRKSLSGYVFTLFGTAVNWKSNLQSVVALSTIEVEYNALAEGVKEGLWLKEMLHELGIEQETVQIHCDSQSAIHLANHQMYHAKTKHIDVKCYFIYEVVESGAIKLVKTTSEDNPVDMLTKSLPRDKFEKCLSLVGFF